MYKEKQKSISWLESQAKIAKIAELKKDENYFWLKEVNYRMLFLKIRESDMICLYFRNLKGV